MFTVPSRLTVTSVEMVTTVALCAVFALGLSRRLWWPRPIVLPGAAFLAVLLAAAVAAPIEQGNALRFVARMLTASMVCVLFVNVADRTDRARAIVRVLVSMGVLVATIALLEVAQVAAVMSALTVFRPGFHVVGGQLRATSTLFYPTIASMYLEMAFALGLWLLLDPASRRPRLERVGVFTALAIIGAGITATFTRAGLFGMAAALIVVASAGIARLGRAQTPLGLLRVLGSVLIAIVVASRSPDLLITRLGSEGSQPWYGAHYQAPSSLRVETGSVGAIPIVVTNTGRLTWDSTRDPAFAMSYHWLRAGSEAVVQFDGNRTPFPSLVRPGATVSLPVSVRAPGEAGAYTLVWDVVHETRAWFSTEGVVSPRTEVQVEGARSVAVVTEMDRLPRASIRPTRLELWSAALGIARERPWLGLGPDNFRHGYGPYIGLERWDTRVHANNMYLEILAGAGIAGFLALVWLLASAGIALWRRCHTAPSAWLMPAASALAAWVMVVGHGLVDSFLSFTTTYLVFAIAAGLAFSRGFAGDEAQQRRDPRNVLRAGPHLVEVPDADRV